MQNNAIPHAPGRRGAVAVVLDQDRFLVIRRAVHVVAPRAYCFPGGAIESGETEEQALMREMHEELAVAVQPRRRVWQSVTPWQVQMSWWLADLAADAAIRPNPAEVESVHWFTSDEMLALPELLESNRHFLVAWKAGEIVLE